MPLAAATPLADILEKELQAQVFELLQTLGWRRAYHVFDSRRSQHGFPDLVAVRERVLWIELKRERGKLTDDQKHWLRALDAANAEVYLIRPRHLQALATILAHHGDPRSDGAVAHIAIGLREETRKETA